SSTLLRRPRSPLFPYTTLFRSRYAAHAAAFVPACRDAWPAIAASLPREKRCKMPHVNLLVASAYYDMLGASMLTIPGRVGCVLRSEEHTSELQSRENLVCRLLL